MDTKVVDRKVLFNIPEHRVLTPQEYLIVGGTLDEKFLTKPRMPVALFDESLAYDDVVRLRREKGVIVSHSAWFKFGVEDPNVILKSAMVFELGKVDPKTHETKGDTPKLVGIYDVETGMIDSGPETLAAYRLTPEGQKALCFETDSAQEDHPSRR